MKLRDYIVILIGMFLTSLLLQWLKPELVPGPSDPGKEQRDTLNARADLYERAWFVWKDSAAYYKILYQQAASIPPTTIINDAVTAMHAAPVDSVQHVLMSEPR